jgi:hypothetical protein
MQSFIHHAPDLAQPLLRSCIEGTSDRQQALDRIAEFRGIAGIATGARPGHVAVIRPDKFVYALVSGRDVATAARHLLRTLDRSPDSEHAIAKSCDRWSTRSAAYFRLELSRRGRPSGLASLTKG